MSKATPITPDERGRIAVNLYKFVLWADTLRIQFEQTLARDRIELDRRRMMKLQILDKTAIEADMYVRLWFGFLYVVVEGWPQLQLKQNQPLQIQELLMNPWSDLLRKFRNATFHPADFDDRRTGK